MYIEVQCEMEIGNIPNDTSTTDERHSVENINIDLCTSDLGKSPLLLECVNNVKEVDNVNIDKNICSVVNIEDYNNKTISTEECKSDNNDIHNDDNVSNDENSDLFSKFVL